MDGWVRITLHAWLGREPTDTEVAQAIIRHRRTGDDLWLVMESLHPRLPEEQRPEYDPTCCSTTVVRSYTAGPV